MFIVNYNGLPRVARYRITAACVISCYAVSSHLECDDIAYMT